VTLREEHVAVERRPADRAVINADEAFRERTIEAEERAEEAVISKGVRITEEVIIHKVMEQRTETISDTVRQTEVEVEDQRGSQISGTTDRT
jgi:stress response protein YsnF